MPIVYFGNESAVMMAKQFISKFGTPEGKPAFLLTGNSGVGKTYLCSYMAQQYKVECYMVNASAKRTGDAIRNIVEIVSEKSRMIVVLDECETMPAPGIIKIIKAAKVPVFLCCNYIDKVDRTVQDLCTICRIEQPQWWVFRKYMESKYKEFGMEIPKNLDDIAKKATSFRHAERLVDDPTDESSGQIENDFTEIEKILHGVPLEHISMEPRELLTWIHDNANVPDLASRVDIILEHAYLEDYRFWGYAYSALATARSNNKIEFPRTYRIMAKVKKSINDGKVSESDHAVLQIDFSKVNVSAVKEGKSLFAGIEDLKF